MVPAIAGAWVHEGDGSQEAGWIRPGCQRAKEPRRSSRGAFGPKGLGLSELRAGCARLPGDLSAKAPRGVDPLAPRAIRTDGPSVLSAVDLRFRGRPG